MKAKRNYSIDLLKCLSMLMVVFLHLGGYGLKEAEYNPVGLIGITNDLLQSFSIVGVNVFVLITGYFISAKNITINRECLIKHYKHLLPLWIQVEMYSVGIYLILCAIPQSGVEFSAKMMIKQALPLLNNQYWFFTDYCLLVIVSPLLNKAIWSLTNQEYRSGLLVVIATFSLLPSLNIFGNSFETEYGFSLLWFIVLYLVAGYIRKNEEEYKSKKSTLCFLAFVLLFFIIRISIDFAPGPLRAVLSLSSCCYTSFFVLVASVALFLAFLKSNHEYKNAGKTIAIISSLSFAVYLIHEHNAFRGVLWRELVGLERYTDTPGICLLIMFLSVVCIYFGSISVEFIRIKIILLISFVVRKVWKKKGNEFTS